MSRFLSRKSGTNFRSTSFDTRVMVLAVSCDHEISPWETVVGATVPETNSYPKLCIRSPQADSMAATDSGASCDFHPPLIAERTKGLSLRVPLRQNPLGGFLLLECAHSFRGTQFNGSL